MLPTKRARSSTNRRSSKGEWADEVAIREPDQPPAYPPNEDGEPVAHQRRRLRTERRRAAGSQAWGHSFQTSSSLPSAAGCSSSKPSDDAGPVMVVFYLGHWCPPCNKQLSDVQSIYDDIRFRDMSVVAISADPRDDSTNWIMEQQFTFPMAVDVELNFIKRVRLEHPEREVAIHAIYMLDQDGKIFYAKVGGRRPTPQELLDAIDYHKGNWPPKS